MYYLWCRFFSWLICDRVVWILQLVYLWQGTYITCDQGCSAGSSVTGYLYYLCWGLTLDSPATDTGLTSYWHWTHCPLTLDSLATDTGPTSHWHRTDKSMKSLSTDTGLTSNWHCTHKSMKSPSTYTGLTSKWHWTHQLLTLDLPATDLGTLKMQDNTQSEKMRALSLSVWNQENMQPRNFVPFIFGRSQRLLSWSYRINWWWRKCHF